MLWPATVELSTQLDRLKPGRFLRREIMAGGMRMRLWSENDVERLRENLPKIANGRKTRHQKKQSAISSQPLAKSKTKAKKRKEEPQPKKKSKKP